MAKQLSPSSEFLHVLDSRFYRTIKLTKYRFLVGEEWVENFSILPWYISLIPRWSKPTVERHSGGRYFNTIQAPNGQMMPNTDHFSIVKPAGADALPHQWLWAFYQNKFAPRVQLPAIVDTADQILQSIDGPKSLVDSDGEYARTRTEIQKLSDQCEKIAVSFCDAVVARVGTEVDRHFSLFEAALQKAHNARAKFREFGDHRAELYSAWISLDTAIEAKDWEQARVELIAYQDLASSIASATEIDVDDPDYAWYNNWNMIVDLLEIELNLETGFVKAAESQLQGLSRQITSIGTPAHRLLQLQVSIMLAGKMKSERDIVSMSSRKRTVCVQMEYKFDRELQICLGQLNIIEAGAWIEAGRESSAKGAAIEAESRAEAAGDLAMRAESLYLWAKSDSLSHSISSEAQNRLSEAAEISGNIGWSPMMYKIFDLRSRLPSDQNTQPP